MLIISKRIFIAFDAPKQVQRCLRKLYDYTSLVRWTRPENLHITLAFLGNLDERQLARLQDTLPDVTKKHKPLRLEIETVSKQREMVWAEIKPSRKLSSLYEYLQESLIGGGFLLNARSKFRPHINLGRFHQNDSNCAYWKDIKPSLTSFVVDHLVIFESRLLSDGPRYTSIDAYPMQYG